MTQQFNIGDEVEAIDINNMSRSHHAGQLKRTTKPWVVTQVSSVLHGRDNEKWFRLVTADGYENWYMKKNFRIVHKNPAKIMEID